MILDNFEVMRFGGVTYQIDMDATVNRDAEPWPWPKGEDQKPAIDYAAITKALSK